jgi:hypothetical protein
MIFPLLRNPASSDPGVRFAGFSIATRRFDSASLSSLKMAWQKEAVFYGEHPFGRGGGAQCW